MTNMTNALAIELDDGDLDQASGGYLKYKLQDAVISGFQASAPTPAPASLTPVKKP